MKLRVLSVAEVEFYEVATRYEFESAGGGERLITASEALFAEIVEHPYRYPYYEAGTLKQKYRRARVGKSPYYIVYRIEAEEVVVVAYAHASRAPGYWEQR